jgi:FlaA1/EpsC-like NDP-sugar epimerase
MILPKSNVPRWILIVLDVCISSFSLLCAYLIRFDFNLFSDEAVSEWSILSKSIFFFVLVKVVVFYFFGIHRGLIRHSSTQDFKRLALACFTASCIFLVGSYIRFWFMDGFYLFPRQVLILEFLCSIFLFISSRFLIKLAYLESVKGKIQKEEVAIFGAGVLGLITKRTIEKDPSSTQDIVAFIDDNPKMKGSRLENLLVWNSNDLGKLKEKEGIGKVIIAIEGLDPTAKRTFVEKCLALNIKIQSVPSAKKWMNGEFSARQISNIKIEDLLGRKQIQLDSAKISADLQDKIILITGAAGSIGSGLVREIIAYSPKQIILFDQAESALYDLQQELNGTSNCHLEFVIGDIRNTERIDHLFNTFQPQIVFHAAAYKHVPLMEDNPSEAILTNIKGTKNLVDAAVKYKADKFVMISTDKAVNPTNVMGASKRIAEIYAQFVDKSSVTQFITTRFGNVLGSNGSVIPLFKRQIEQGGPLTLTDERITRFFMTIPEACQLVLEAGTIGCGGEILVFDMGESVKIVDLAKRMIQLSGLEVGTDIEIKVTGLRPGEKLYEELLSSEENTIPTHHPQILKAKNKEEDAVIIQKIEELLSLFSTQNNFKIVELMKIIVPEYISNNSQYQQLDK